MTIAVIRLAPRDTPSTTKEFAMKKILIPLIAVLAALALAGCGGVPVGPSGRATNI